MKGDCRRHPHTGFCLCFISHLTESLLLHCALSFLPIRNFPQETICLLTIDLISVFQIDAHWDVSTWYSLLVTLIVCMCNVGILTWDIYDCGPRVLDSSKTSAPCWDIPHFFLGENFRDIGLFPHIARGQKKVDMFDNSFPHWLFFMRFYAWMSGFTLPKVLFSYLFLTRLFFLFVKKCYLDSKCCVYDVAHSGKGTCHEAVWPEFVWSSGPTSCKEKADFFQVVFAYINYDTWVPHVHISQNNK